MRENIEKWMELCAQAATEQDSRKLIVLIEQITALLDAKQERWIEKIRSALSRIRLTKPTNDAPSF